MSFPWGNSHWASAKDNDIAVQHINARVVCDVPSLHLGVSALMLQANFVTIQLSS